MNTLTDAAALTEKLAAADGIVLVEFGAEWCPPCRMIEPVLAELSAANVDLEVVAVDTDAAPELASRFDVMSVPTLVFFVDGRPISRLVGARGLSAMQAELERVRASAGLVAAES